LPLPSTKEHTMTHEKAKEIEADRELALEDLDAISGGLGLPETRIHILELNPQPLPP
jgi:hypothetical protein